MKMDRAGAELAIGIPFFKASEGGSIGMGVGSGLNYDFSKKIRLSRRISVSNCEKFWPCQAD